MEIMDKSIIEGLKREKNEEVGEMFKIKIYPLFSFNLLFKKKEGNSMVLPHYLAIYENGKINLNEEYSDYQWIEINKLKDFEPKIPTIPEAVNNLLKLEKIVEEKEFILI